MRARLAAVLLLASPALEVACQRSGAAGDVRLPGFVGTWRLVSRSGGMMGKRDSLTTEERLVVSAEGTAAFYVADSVASSGPFNLSREKSIFTGEQADAVTFSGGGPPSIIEIRGDTLVLANNCYDCFASTYVRVK